MSTIPAATSALNAFELANGPMTPTTSVRHSHMLIIAGHLIVNAAERDSYVADCVPVVEAARAHAGCLDFSISADTIDPAQIRIYERWESEETLMAFRGSGPSSEQQTAIASADVKRYGVASVGDP